MLALQQHPHSIQTEQIASLERSRAVRHFIDRHSAGVGGPDQRADARPRHHRRLDAHFLERAENSDVREAFQATAAQDERDLVRFASRLAGRQSREFARGIAGHANGVCGRL